VKKLVPPYDVPGDQLQASARRGCAAKLVTPRLGTTTLRFCSTPGARPASRRRHASAPERDCALLQYKAWLQPAMDGERPVIITALRSTHLSLT